MSDITTIVDQVGRTVIGVEVKSTKDVLVLNNPVIIHVQPNQQNGQLQVQSFPYLFMEFIKGDKNPVYQNSYNTLVNIDSSFRDSNTNSSSNFLSTLTFAVSNVIEYSVYSLEIPYSWYFFSKSYGNTTLIFNI